MLTLYKAFVRPAIEYASTVWCPFTITNQDKIERVQRRLCRIIHVFHDLPYKNQLQLYGLLSLRARRLRFQLIMLYKIVNNLVDVDVRDHFTFRRDHRTRGHSLTINGSIFFLS